MPTKASVGRQRLSGVVDELNARHGSKAVRVGVPPKTRAGVVGTKIAFTRVPKLAESNE